MKKQNNSSEILLKKYFWKNVIVLFIILPIFIVWLYLFLITFESLANKINVSNILVFSVNLCIILFLYKNIRNKIAPKYYPNMKIMSDYIKYGKLKKILSIENFKPLLNDELWASRNFLYLENLSARVKVSGIFISKHMIQSITVMTNNKSLFNIFITTYNNKIFKIGSFNKETSKSIVENISKELNDVIIDDEFTNILITNKIFVTDVYNWFHNKNKRKQDFVNNIYKFDKNGMPNYLEYKENNDL